MSHNYTIELVNRTKKVKLLLLDVDGVLTDGSLFYTGREIESKVFNTQDGFGLRLLEKAQIDTGIITARQSDIVAKRAEELHIRYLRQKAHDKLEALEGILKKTNFGFDEIAYMGDDWLDLPILSRVGLAAAPANAVAEVKSVAHFISSRNGGMGAVRDLCDLLLTAKGIKDSLLEQYSK